MKPALRARLVLAGSLLAWILTAAPSAASVGVGIDTGKIELTESLAPGGIYHLPSIGVINTGDETVDYQVDITYLDEQTEMRPAPAWFNFEPNKFTLPSGISRRITPTLQVPVDARAGDYFALIEASPAARGKGTAAIGLAAATKLSFTVREANLASAVLHRGEDLFRDFTRWFYFGLAAAAAIGLALVFRHHFRFSIKMEKKG